MKYAIIGAGISGLSIANLLKKSNEVVVFEADNRPGGMMKCDIVNGCLFHRTGGHVFNTKRKDVMDWFWSFFDISNHFTKASRNAAVCMQNDNYIPYPFENHVYMLNKEVGISIVKDFMSIAKREVAPTPKNFEDFLKNRFGSTLYQLYFQPYNYKIWRRDLSKIPLSWLEGKLPMPTIEEIIYNNLYHLEENTFVHSSFYYPIKGGSQFLIDTFAQGIEIRNNAKIEILIPDIQNGYRIGEEHFDRVVFCGNIKQLPSLLRNSINLSAYIKEIESLEFHGTTSVFCNIDNNPYSWIYLPSREYESHRIICTGNFSETNNCGDMMTGIIEFTDYISEEEIKINLTKMPMSPQYITHHYEKYSYPIQNQCTRNMIKNLKSTLAKHQIYLCGRFAEWEYANMDVCMGYAIDLYNNHLSYKLK